jgi:hypothetical protein
MYTSIALVVLVGSPVAPGEQGGLRWQTDYAQARKQAQQEKKPLAVFLATGQEGHGKVAADGKLSPAARKLLGSDYVCVYLDTGSQEGKRLARAFQVTEPTGLVISDRTGDFQAFRYNGTLSDEELTRSLKRFADPDHVVSTTITSVHERVSYYPPQTSNGTTTYPAAPSSGGMIYYPQPGYGTFGGFGGFGGGRGC